ncbi:MAG: protein translocase subunit SecD [Patescibacteria group bacterium]|jgi:preprotein translocase subunit SecD
MKSPIRKKILNTFLVILSLVVLSLIVNMPQSLPINVNWKNININTSLKRPDFSFKLGNTEFKKDLDLKFGLDLAGGASLVYNVDTKDLKKEDMPQALESLKENIERRVNLFGISEANVQISNEMENYRLTVELPGIEDIDQAINLIGQTARLNFRGEVEIAPEATQTATIYDLFAHDTGLNGSHLVRSAVVINPNNSQPEVSLEFNNDGAKLFETATKDFLNKRIAIFLDDIPITFPTVQTVITDGKAVINGSFGTQEAKSLSAQLNAGALPLPIEMISQNQIGATLGKDTIDKGIKAGLVGLATILIFMIGNYGRLGLFASLGLITYGLFTLTLYRLIPVTLTFPGIVGFILSVGMAVDSNILVFERIKEETRKGKPWNVAVDLGFGKTWEAIKDTNISSLIIALILFNPFNWSFLNTSGMVRGFAVTFLLGIIIGLFTSIVVTKNFIKVFTYKLNNQQIKEATV